MKEEKIDNINRILKSISPKANTYSKMSKKLDMSFKYANLENLIKSLDVKYVYKDQFEPEEEVVIHKNDYNVNFQSSYDILAKLSDLNNLPLVLQNKNCIKDGEFNPDFEYDTGKKEINKKYIKEEEDKRKKERLKKRIELLKRFKENDSNIDSGNYHPNYDAIKRRYPSVYIRDPNIHIKDTWLINCPFRNTYEDFKKKENEKKENSNNKNSNNIEKSPNQINKININKSNISNNNIFTRINNMKKNSSFNSNENSLRSMSTNEIREKNDDIYLLKEKNIKLKNKMFKKLKNLSLPLVNMPIRESISNFYNLKKRISRSTSYDNFLGKKSPIIFNKMKARPNIFVEKKYLISYNPNYDSTFPHVPSTIFKYTKNKQNYKKYINGKIIRGYFFNPRDYYVMEIQKEEEKKKKKLVINI